MKIIRCRATLQSKTQTQNGYEVELTPVTGGCDEERARYFKYTPFGHFKFGTINEAAAASMVVGRDYYVDFTPASDD